MLINIDNGGTFTDICVIDRASVHRVKTPTTPFDLSECFFEGLTKVSAELFGEPDLGELLAKTTHIRYSTTQGTNALVERKGPRLGLIVEASEDPRALVVNGSGGDAFDALVGNRIAGLAIRKGSEGYEDEIVAAINELTRIGANRVVLSLSTADAERDVEKIIRKRFPGHLLGTVPVLAATHLSEDDEFARRTWSALVNAFLHPAMEKFLYYAENRLKDRKFVSPLLIYRNDGDSGRVAKTTALRTYSSGPRGGMDGAKALAEHYGFSELLSMDVGGTTTDIGLVNGRGIRQLNNGSVIGMPISFPLCDIESVGVGGGSILRTEDGAIVVGPESVGATPGPACFGLGGKEATITDFALLSGVIDPSTYFGGKMALDRSRAEAVVREKIAEPLGLSLEDALLEMERAWVAKVAKALKDFTPFSKDTVLGAFGGGGPLEVCAVAEQAGISKVVVPELAAVFCALGIGFSDVGHSYEARIPEGAAPEEVDELARLLERRGQRDMFAEGFEPEEFEAALSLKRVRGEEVETRPLASLAEAHRHLDGESTAFLGYRVHMPLPRPSFAGKSEAGRHRLASSATREVLGRDGRRSSVPLYEVAKLQPGAKGAGPAIIEDPFFTLRVPDGWGIELSPNRDIILTRNRSGGGR